MTYSVDFFITQNGWPLAAVRTAVIGTLAAEAGTDSAAAGTLADVTIEPRTWNGPWSHAA